MIQSPGNLISFLFPILFIPLILTGFKACRQAKPDARKTEIFNRDYKFHLGNISDAHKPSYNDSEWIDLNLPHDWSIEGAFSAKNPATPGGGALPGGIGWYRKTFSLPGSKKNRLFFITFAGVYRNRENWINRVS
jgi:beta-galactosidase